MKPRRVKMVATESVSPNPWNPNVVSDETMLQLVANVKRVGLTMPILVREVEGGYEVVDGEHRLKAAMAAELEMVPVVVVKMTDAEAKAQTVAMNKLRGEMPAAEVAVLLQKIEPVLPLEELAQYVGYSLKELQAARALLDFDPATLAALPEGEDEPWLTITIRCPESTIDVVMSELDRLKGAMGTDFEHLALELMAVNSLQAVEA